MIIEGAVHSDPLFLSSPQIKEGMMEFLRGQPVTVTKITAAPMKFAPLVQNKIFRKRRLTQIALCLGESVDFLLT